MIAETAETKICETCWVSKPEAEFRFKSRATGERHNECRDCRREADRLKRERARDQRFQGGLRDLRRSQTPEQILNVLEAIAEDLGGIEAVVDEFSRLIRDDSVPPTRRMKAAETLLYCQAVADMQQAADALKPEPDRAEAIGEYLERLHAEGRLLPALRELVDRGKLALDELLDGVDPPPVVGEEQ